LYSWYYWGYGDISKVKEIDMILAENNLGERWSVSRMLQELKTELLNMDSYEVVETYNKVFGTEFKLLKKS